MSAASSSQFSRPDGVNSALAAVAAQAHGSMNGVVSNTTDEREQPAQAAAAAAAISNGNMASNFGANTA